MNEFGIMNNQEEKRITQEIGIHIEDLAIDGNQIDLISGQEEVFNQLTEMLVEFNTMIRNPKIGIPVVQQHIKKMLHLVPTKNARLRIVAGIYQMISDQSRYRKFRYIVKDEQRPRISESVAQKQKELAVFYRGRLFQAVASGMDSYNRVEWVSLCYEATYYGLTEEEINRISSIAKKRYGWN
ncbi:MAG: hypothetical protein V1712_00620 [Patescibacteria group bacterium]